jgi:hypothetical protein
MDFGEAQEFVVDVMVDNMLDADAVEGIGAFIAKRPPKWKTE